MTRIIRYRVIPEHVEIPEGRVVCPNCKGRGILSKYDEGVRSVVFDADLAAKRECFQCHGQGHIPEENINV